MIRTKVSYELVKTPQVLLLELKLTGHFNDIFCGPAIMSSSSVMACTTGEAGQQQPLQEGKNLTFLLNLLSTSEVMSSEVLN